MTPMLTTAIVDVFVECYAAVRRGDLIRRESRRDKEFHFQDWFGRRLTDMGLQFDPVARNAYPDFRLVHDALGFEIKGLRFPGRVATYDSNSQTPVGLHHGRDIVYVFGRYPVEPLREDEYPVYDLILCHGSFLNVDTDYVHENKNVRGFGSYGDIMIRDRKMYVAPTPFALTTNTEGQITLILPEASSVDGRVISRGELIRVEADALVVGYSFDLQSNQLSTRVIPNPNSGRRHRFVAYRVASEPGSRVAMAS
jgi:hypothetical protein